MRILERLFIFIYLIKFISLREALKGLINLRFFGVKVEVFYTKGGGFLYLGEQSLYELLKY